MESRNRFLPYGRQNVTAEDIDAVAEVLRSDWLTQGPDINVFEDELARVVSARHAVACSSGTAALHIAMLALGLGPGDRIVTSPNTFLADASCARYCGADVTFADIDPDTGNMTPEQLRKVLSTDAKHRIKAVIPVNFAGQPVHFAEIYELTRQHGAALVSDACHALGATYEHEEKTVPLGSGVHADMSVFSFHPVKHVAMGEGGAVTTDDDELAKRLALFRNHGITKADFVNTDMAIDAKGEVNPWYYELQELGLNYRLSDIHAALGLMQLKRLERSVATRTRIADWYREELARRFPDGGVTPLRLIEGVRHAYHLFVVRIDFGKYGVGRGDLMRMLRDNGIGTQVHYIPIHLQPYYREHCGTGLGDYPGAEEYYEGALSIPMYPEITRDDVRYVVEQLHRGLTGQS